MRTHLRDTTVRTTTAMDWQVLCEVDPGHAATIRCRVECNWSPVLPEFELHQTPEDMLVACLGHRSAVQQLDDQDRFYCEFEAPIVYPGVPVTLSWRSPRGGTTVEVSEVQLEWDPDDNNQCKCGVLFKDHDQIVGTCPPMREAVRKLRELGPAKPQSTIWDRLLDPLV